MPQTKIALTESQRWVILNALTKAAQRDREAARNAYACPSCQDRPGYNGLGKTCKTCKGSGYVNTPTEYLAPLARTLEQQAIDAEAMYALIENADSIEVSQ